MFLEAEKGNILNDDPARRTEASCHKEDCRYRIPQHTGRVVHRDIVGLPRYMRMYLSICLSSRVPSLYTFSGLYSALPDLPVRSGRTENHVPKSCKYVLCKHKT